MAVVYEDLFEICKIPMTMAHFNIRLWPMPDDFTHQKDVLCL